MVHMMFRHHSAIRCVGLTQRLYGSMVDPYRVATSLLLLARIITEH